MILLILFAALMLSGCAGGGTDMGPVGGGLAVIGLALIIGAVIEKLPTNEKGGDDES